MKYIQQISKVLLPLLFLVVIFLPFVNNLFKVWEFERTDENRTFRDTLTADIQRLDKFPKDAEEYLNDNFSFRTPLLKVYQNIKYEYFNISPYPNKTIAGEDGWFFKAGDEIEIYEGHMGFSEGQLDQLEKKWISRNRYFDSLNIKSYWVIAPIKHNIYSEKLPFNLTSNGTRRVEQITQRFKDKLPNLIIDPYNYFVEQKTNGQLYYKLDNHWNFKAGFLATELTLAKLKNDFKNTTFDDLKPVWKDTLIRSGYHRAVMGIDKLEEIEKIPFFSNNQAKKAQKYGFPPLKGFPYPSVYEQRFIKESAKSGLRILVIRDSFGKNMIAFVNELFNESVYIFDAWKYGTNKSIVESFNPDVVLYIGLETHINNMLNSQED